MESKKTGASVGADAAQPQNLRGGNRVLLSAGDPADPIIDPLIGDLDSVEAGDLLTDELTLPPTSAPTEAPTVAPTDFDPSTVDCASLLGGRKFYVRVNHNRYMKMLNNPRDYAVETKNKAYATEEFMWKFEFFDPTNYPRVADIKSVRRGKYMQHHANDKFYGGNGDFKFHLIPTDATCKVFTIKSRISGEGDYWLMNNDNNKIKADSSEQNAMIFELGEV